MAAAADETWPVTRVRQQFVEYFKEKHEHKFVESSPVVPYEDPTLLFANAGMNQFKPIFVGKVDPSSPLAKLERAVNSQKCIRAGGKHNDLDDVGLDTYHHTFFEMLGTWSFGDYFKAEAINWAWELLVKVYGLNPDQLYATYFGGDEALGVEADLEARDLWLQYLPESRVLPFDSKDNFWEMGDTGPCGPCSEIHFDRIGGRDAAPLVNADDPNVVEIWNLVFMQYNREDASTLKSLPNKHIDTGMGLERLVSVLQNKMSNYDTDCFMPILEAIKEHTNAPRAYEGRLGADDPDNIDMAYRVIADHARTLAYAIADGAQPSNEGRGYVLRRILRRALRYGRQFLDAPDNFFSKVVTGVVVDMGKDFFPELEQKREQILEIVLEEEQAFAKLLVRGLKFFDEVKEKVEKENRKAVSGDEAFFLYDTLGFPVDLTLIMAQEAGLGLDMAGFEACMEQQKERSRAALKKARSGSLGDGVELTTDQVALLIADSASSATDDSMKYEWDITPESTVTAVFMASSGDEELEAAVRLSDGDVVGVVLSETPFYAEAGGQVSDLGTLLLPGGVEIDVQDVQNYGGFILHVGVVSGEGELRRGQTVKSEVDYANRRRIAPNHTMTHVLNLALRNELGDNVDQKGSLCDSDKLRFDFSHGKAMTAKQLASVEKQVQDVIEKALKVETKVLPLAVASEIPGLRAVFGETYPDPVRVVSVGGDLDALSSGAGGVSNEDHMDVSTEFCGGTHLSNSKEAEAFVIAEETAVAKGIRRIVALTGEPAKAAQLRGESLREDVKKLEQLDPLDPNLDASCVELRQTVDGATMSTVVKADLRSFLEAQAKRAVSAKKKALQQRVDKAISDLKATLAELPDHAKYAVVEVDIGGNGKALQPLFKAVQADYPDIRLFGYSKVDDDDKALFFALCPKDSSLKANEWITQTLQEIGGKGGGTPLNAQGNGSAAELSAAVAKAEAFAKAEMEGVPK
eukprot:scaffold2952_cov312-Pinguiococcus_pyrenoidosus.AAC.9